MSDLNKGGFSLGQATPVSIPQSAIRKLSDEECAREDAQFKSVLEGQYSRPTDGNNGDYGTYAKVVVNGKVVATLANSGSAMMSNALSGQLSSQLVSDGSGPELAQRRAEQIARELGGTVVKSSSAMNPSDWSKRAPIKTAIDFEAMAADGKLDLWKRLSASASRFNTQMLGQGETGVG